MHGSSGVTFPDVSSTRLLSFAPTLLIDLAFFFRSVAIMHSSGRVSITQLVTKLLHLRHHFSVDQIFAPLRPLGFQNRRSFSSQVHCLSLFITCHRSAFLAFRCSSASWAAFCRCSSVMSLVIRKLFRHVDALKYTDLSWLLPWQERGLRYACPDWRFRSSPGQPVAITPSRTTPQPEDRC